MTSLLFDNRYVIQYTIATLNVYGHYIALTDFHCTNNSARVFHQQMISSVNAVFRQTALTKPGPNVRFGINTTSMILT